MRLKSGAEAEVGFEFEPQCTQQEAVKWRNPCQVFNVWGLVQGPSPPLASFKPETAQRPASRLTDHSRERERGWAGYPTLQQVGFRGAVCPSPAVWPAQRCRSSPPSAARFGNSSLAALWRWAEACIEPGAWRVLFILLLSFSHFLLSIFCTYSSVCQRSLTTEPFYLRFFVSFFLSSCF
jgi:hypothetical protein